MVRGVTVGSRLSMSQRDKRKVGEGPATWYNKSGSGSINLFDKVFVSINECCYEADSPWSPVKRGAGRINRIITCK